MAAKHACSFCGSYVANQKRSVTPRCFTCYVKTNFKRGLPGEVLADPDVKEWASRYCWRIYAHGKARIPYVRRTQYANGKRIVIFLHREIMDCPSEMQIDHANGNSLDNRRCNLRIVDKCGNMQNRVRIQKNNKSGVRGVTWSAAMKKWKCTAQAFHKQYHLGYFANLTEAEKCVRTWRVANMPYSMELV